MSERTKDFRDISAVHVSESGKLKEAQAELTASTHQREALIAEQGSMQDKLDQYQKAIGQLNQIAKVMEGYDSRKDFIKDKNSCYTLRNV